MIEAYKLFWLNFFKLKGRSRRRLILVALLINAIIEVIVLNGTKFIENSMVHGHIISSIIYQVISLILCMEHFHYL